MHKYLQLLNVKWLILFALFSGESFSLTSNKASDTLMGSFSFETGKGTFKQSKSFKFMSMPIVSNGKFLVDGKRVLWQTTVPVNSEILLTGNAVYKKNTTDNEFKLLVKDSPVNNMLSAILTGNIDQQDWAISEFMPADVEKSISCLTMHPKSQQLISVFTSAQLCLKNDKQREVVLLDKQNNKTVIEMNISDELLTVEDKLSLETP